MEAFESVDGFAEASVEASVEAFVEAFVEASVEAFVRRCVEAFARLSKLFCLTFRGSCRLLPWNLNVKIRGNAFADEF